MRVKVTLTFPDGLPRAVVDDRIYMLCDGRLSLQDAGAVIESWDTSHIEQ